MLRVQTYVNIPTYILRVPTWLLRVPTYLRIQSCPLGVQTYIPTYSESLPTCVAGPNSYIERIYILRGSTCLPRAPTHRLEYTPTWRLLAAEYLSIE